VSFFTNTYIEKDGKLPIYARITVDGKRVELSIKRDVEKGIWDDGKGSVKDLYHPNLCESSSR
jgi:hypothetical protein